jgi:hypothetical protein
MNCILFLDFDGVTHPDPCSNDQYFRQLPLIEGVLRQWPSVEVVISSTWRYDHDLEGLRRYLSPDIRSRVIDVTPTVRLNDDEGWVPRHLLAHHREWECRKWMRQHRPPGAAWIAIDDATGWFVLGCANLLSTESTSGFLPGHAAVLNQMLKDIAERRAEGSA